jgi:hypothetical protein
MAVGDGFHILAILPLNVMPNHQVVGGCLESIAEI